MVIKTLNEYMLDSMIDRVKTLQNALNQAENIITNLEKENHALKDALSSLASHNEGYGFDTEVLNEPMLST